jgi:hypothetical protein
MNVGSILQMLVARIYAKGTVMNRWIAAFSTAACVVLLPAVEAYACSCMRPGPANEAAQEAAAVFVAEVVGSSAAGDGTILVDMNVMKTLKGDVGATTAVRTRSNSAACGYNFSNGVSYLVYAFRSGEGELVVSLCSRTAPAANVADEIALLEGLPPRQLATGQVPPNSDKTGADVVGTNSDSGKAPQTGPKAKASAGTPPPTKVEPAFDDTDLEPSKKQRDSTVVTAGAQQGEGRDDIQIPGPDSAPVAAISAHTMFRYTMNIDADDSAELYNLRIYLKKTWDDFVFYAEPRFRQTPLRNFSPSNIWVQQVWVGYDILQGVRARAGLINTSFSRPWDNSWFGNLPYLNGLKLDPDYGVDIGGSRDVSDLVAVDYTLQWLPASDGLNGFFSTTDKMQRLNALPGDEVVLDFDSTPGYGERQAIVGRLVPALKFGDFKIAAGGSIYTSEISNPADESGRKFAVGAEGEISWRGAALYGEYVDTEVSIESDALKWQHMGAGASYTWSRDSRWLKQAQGRVNVTTTDYTRSQSFNDDIEAGEFFATAGAYVRLHEMLGLTAEYVFWDFEDDEIVNRVEWILHAYF